MARKTFISYKYSDSRATRDRIIEALGDDAVYYTGESSESPFMGDLKTETIKRKLADMIYPTSVMIVIISRNVDMSQWVEWEINYASSKQTRGQFQSQPNGIVMVIEDYLLSDNKYTPNKTTELISTKSNPYIISISNFLRMPQLAIEEAFKSANK